MRRHTGMLLVLGATMVTLLVAAPVICPKCGWEMRDTDQVCTHCGADLPRPKPTGEPSSESDKATRRMLSIDPEIVETEITMGVEQLKAGNPELARLFFRNAAALNLLTEHQTGVTDERGSRILQLTAESEQQLKAVRRPCSECGGSGKKSMTVTTLDGKVERKEVPGSICPTCDGQGYVVTAGTIDEQKFRMGRVLSVYAGLQQGRRMVRVGEAWVPVRIADQLGVRQRVLLKCALALPCSDCMGLGRNDCRGCQGLGRVKCPNPRCETGLVTVESVGLISDIRLKRREKCKVCGGTGSVFCAECKGTGCVLCKSCHGTGARGHCRRCNGEGLTSCGHCRGAGVLGGQPCPECRGEGVTECSTCGGDGRKR